MMMRWLHLVDLCTYAEIVAHYVNIFLKIVLYVMSQFYREHLLKKNNLAGMYWMNLVHAFAMMMHQPVL